MAKCRSILLKIDNDGTKHVFNLDTRRVEEFKVNNHKFICREHKDKQDSSLEILKYNRANTGNHRILILNPSDSYTDRITVIEQFEDKFYGSLGDTLGFISYDRVQSLVDNGLINNLILSSEGYITYNGKPTKFKLVVPDLYKNFVDSYWRFLGDRPMEGTEVIQVTENNKYNPIGNTVSHLNFYKLMLSNSLVGNILSIPTIILPDLHEEIIKILEGRDILEKRTTVSRLKLSIDDRAKDVVGILVFDKNLDYFQFQVMNNPRDNNSIPIDSIDTQYYKWRQSRKFIALK